MHCFNDKLNDDDDDDDDDDELFVLRYRLVLLQGHHKATD